METRCYLSFQMLQYLDEGEEGLHLRGGERKALKLVVSEG